MNHIENITKLFSKSFVENPLLESFEAGVLHLSSGRLVACDPIITPDKTAFNQLFPKGDFSIMIHKEISNNCVAYSEIIFESGDVDSWVMALCDNQKLEDLEEGEIFGFPVESGMSALMDLDSQQRLNDYEQELFHKKGVDFLGIYEEFFHTYFYDSNGAIDQFAMMKPYPEEKANLLAFEAGYGEGFYASYIGYNKAKQPIKFVTEFIEIQ
ncbi:DUF4241 domain-containing protein [Chryseobacterium sp. POL2]|uniref:DUF4241 domain-containing protein n=1 Tax=Chryseobacterium sp. POL2 TaxID=2713414 RepID=UPI0013E151C3|nr:DUF4241 domain-containing protein [Chryseobacterium sp. POL2]QIG89439.1 DUF4241 domain-containing protein [Chryseobacterium sp. POL2]